MTQIDRAATRRRPDGPSAGVLATVCLVLTLASVLIPPLFGDSAGLTGFLVFGASVPLGIYTATVYARLLRLGVRVPGPAIGFFGGIAASVLLSLSGLLTWVLGQSLPAQSEALVRTVELVAFALGGVGFVGGLGLLIAGIAVPALILRLTPRWLAWAGLVIAALAELSFFAMIAPALTFLLPACRFLGLAWILVAGFLLPHTRHRERPQED